EWGVEILPRPNLTFDAKMVVPIYVQDEQLEGLGKYISTTRGYGLATDGQEIFLTLKEATGQPGQRYLLLRDGGQLEDGASDSSGAHHHGYIVEVIAEVQLEDRAEAERESGYDHWRARVLKTIGLSLKGTVVADAKLTTFSTDAKGPMANIKAEII